MKVWLLAARPKTLPAAIAPVLIASALAAHDGVFNALPAAIALLFSLLIQIGTNYSNDYYDFIKGADTPERIGPTRAVASGLVSPRKMAVASTMVFLLAFMVGMTLIPYGGWWLVPVGIASIASGIAYTGGPYPLGYNGLGDLFVFIFFGLIAVTLTYLVQAGTVSTTSCLLALVPGALSTNILAVNNYRDYETDLRAGKRTLVVRLGKRAGLIEYGAMLLLANVVPLILFGAGFRVWIFLPLLAFPLGVALLAKMARASGKQAFDKVLAGTAAYMLLFTALLCSGLLLG